MQRLFWLVAFSALLGLSACTRTVPSVSSVKDEDTSDDNDTRDVAMKALRAIGANVEQTTGRCAACHNINVYTLRAWTKDYSDLRYNCVKDSSNDPVDPTMAPDPALVDCLRKDPNDATSPFEPQKLGIFAAGAHLPIFATIFQKAYPQTEWAAKYEAFKAVVQMPITGENQMTADEFASVLAWADEGLPLLEELVGQPGGAPTSCQDERSPELLTYIKRMSVEGWEAKNKESGLKMFACADGAEALNCFTQKNAALTDIFPESSATEFGKTWALDSPQTKIRILRDLGFSTSYWMRTSADGRFVANGTSDGSGDDGEDADENGESYGGRISDLQSLLVDGAPRRDIKVAASYDPDFFPDNSGFMFQSTPVGAGFCRLNLIENPATAVVDFSAPQCSGSDSIGLYQAVGASLNGSDYVAISGEFDSDYGSGQGNNDRPYWMESSYVHLTPLVHDGEVYKSLENTEIWTPYLGDWNISPSNELSIARVAGTDPADPNRTIQHGYKVQFIEKHVHATNYSFELKPAATLCIKGGKGKFSFDERFFVTYHYVAADDFAELGYSSPEDPAFVELMAKGTANVYLYDLATGVNHRVTRMGPGQFAIFPHFRSDGWIYFQVNEENSGIRYIAASDAALLVKAASPL